MNVLRVEPEPFHSMRYRSAAFRGGDGELPFLRGIVDRLPDGVDVLIVASDLQGRESETGVGDVGRLLGEVVPEELALLAELGEIPPLDRAGMILAGDLYSREEPHRLGGLGDVRSVWLAFARASAWVVGVAGNHDAFGANTSERDAFARGENWTVLDIALASPRVPESSPPDPRPPSPEPLDHPSQARGHRRGAAHARVGPVDV